MGYRRRVQRQEGQGWEIGGREDQRWERKTGDGRWEMGDRRQETGDRNRDKKDKRWDIEDRS